MLKSKKNHPNSIISTSQWVRAEY